MFYWLFASKPIIHDIRILCVVEMSLRLVIRYFYRITHPQFRPSCFIHIMSGTFE